MIGARRCMTDVDLLGGELDRPATRRAGCGSTAGACSARGAPGSRGCVSSDLHEHPLELGQRDDAPLLVADRGEIAHLGEREQPLVLGVGARHAVEQVDVLGRGQALEGEVLPGATARSRCAHHRMQPAHDLVLDEALGPMAEGERVDGRHPAPALGLARRPRRSGAAPGATAVPASASRRITASSSRVGAGRRVLGVEVGDGQVVVGQRGGVTVRRRPPPRRRRPGRRRPPPGGGAGPGTGTEPAAGHGRRCARTRSPRARGRGSSGARSPRRARRCSAGSALRMRAVSSGGERPRARDERRDVLLAVRRAPGPRRARRGAASISA